MGILIAYFIFIASTLAVIVTSWVGIADSGVAGLHLQRPSAIQQSYDTSVMAEDSGNTPTTDRTATALRSGVSQHRADVRPHARAHLARRSHGIGADPHLALGGKPLPDEGH